MSVTAWWQAEEARARFLADLIAAEVARLRPGEPAAAPLDMLDSIELLSVAGAVSEALHLHESGIEDLLLGHRRIEDWRAIAREALTRFDAAITFRTSGSTGEPKPCTHALARLEAEAAGHAALIGPRQRVLSAVPSHHIYGFLFTQLLPRHLGGLPVLDLRGTSPAGVAAKLQPGDLVIGHPAWWGAVARFAPGTLPPDIIGVTSTAPCPPATATALRDRGLARLVQVYGSSETAGIGWRDTPDGPFALLPSWTRDGKAIAAPDHLTFLPCGRRFTIEGRADGAVQVAGHNVFPARIRAALEAHPAVAAASVRLMRPEEGDRLKAFIVPRDPASDPAVLRGTLAAWAEATLAPPERPRAWRFGAGLPEGAMGKAADWSCLAEAG